MKPITRAMTAALAALIATTTTACAGSGERLAKAGATPDAERQRIVAVTDNGFVLRIAAPDYAASISAPVADHVPVGAGTHIDARLLSRPTSALQEISHENR